MDGTVTRGLLSLRRDLQASGVPEGEIERRTQMALQGLFQPAEEVDQCVQCRETGWVREILKSRLHPFEITKVKPCACLKGQARAKMLARVNAPRLPRSGFQSVG